MSHLLDDEEKQREVTLGTGAILSLFFGLVVICGLFFGFGYRLGSRKPSPALPGGSAATAASTPGATPAPDFSSFRTSSADLKHGAKPSAGEPNEPHRPPGMPAPGSNLLPSLGPHSAASVTAETQIPASSPHLSTGASASRAAPAPATAPSNPPASAVPGSVFMVQVAAVSHREDADLLLGALRARGYTVAARPALGDNLIHIQVGPFASRTDAEAMRQRLLADGYNAIVK